MSRRAVLSASAIRGSAVGDADRRRFRHDAAPGSRLGNVQYGVWDLLTGLFGYFGLLDLGISPAVLRYVAHSL